ncbi:hypothetical protein MYO4S_00275 [Serratia phage 4S]|nr:hypothetical protein MYO4S_00275 [Serratia phage 4S]
MINLNKGDMIVTEQYDHRQVEVCIFEGMEGYLMVDVTPDRAKMKGHIERYVKKSSSMPYCQRIIRAERFTLQEVIEDARKAKK